MCFCIVNAEHYFLIIVTMIMKDHYGCWSLIILLRLWLWQGNGCWIYQEWGHAAKSSRKRQYCQYQLQESRLCVTGLSPTCAGAKSCRVPWVQSLVGPGLKWSNFPLEWSNTPLEWSNTHSSHILNIWILHTCKLSRNPKSTFTCMENFKMQLSSV